MNVIKLWNIRKMLSNKIDFINIKEYRYYQIRKIYYIRKIYQIRKIFSNKIIK